MNSKKQIQTPLAKSMLTGIFVGFAIAISFVLGFITRDWIGVSVIASPFQFEDEGYPLLDEVQSLLDGNYLRDQPPYNERQYAAIRGVLNSLEDRYTFFIDPPVAQSESDVLAGTYGGAGIQIVRSEDGKLLLFPFIESPARDAGIIEGDILVAINNNPVDFEMHSDQLDQLFRGEVKRGNGIDITFLRNNTEETVFVLFDVINVPSVVWRALDSNEHLGYIQILRFTSRTPEELDEALADLRTNNIEGLVLDLRNNSGGLLQESVEVAERFLDGGVVVYEKSNNNERVFEAAEGSSISGIPIVVLVNGGTASAAELVAGAIGDRDLGILLGQNTFGKGTVQQIYRLSDNSSIHITSAEWFTPSRYALDGQGLEPDIAMIPDENGRDVELGEATRYLLTELESRK